MKRKKLLSEEKKDVKLKRSSRWKLTWNAKHKKNICRNEEFKQKKQNEELETGMVVCKTASEHFGYKVKEEEPQERIITKIPDDQDIAIPPDYPSGYPTLSPSPINSWNREMVNVYELDSLLEHHIREQEMATKCAEDVAAITISDQMHQKEEVAQANKAGIAGNLLPGC